MVRAAGSNSWHLVSSVTNNIAGTVAFVAMSVVPVPHIHGNWIVDVPGWGTG